MQFGSAFLQLLDPVHSQLDLSTDCIQLCPQHLVLLIIDATIQLRQFIVSYGCHLC